MYVAKKDITDVIRKVEDVLSELKKLKKTSGFYGWSVYDSNGYLKAVRRFGKEVRSIHLGKGPMLPFEIQQKILKYSQANGLDICDEPSNATIVPDQ